MYGFVRDRPKHYKLETNSKFWQQYLHLLGKREQETTAERKAISGAETLGLQLRYFNKCGL